MTTYITRFDANQDKNINLHGYILGSERKLIAQNQALERVNRGKFSLNEQKTGGPSCCGNLSHRPTQPAGQTEATNTSLN
jgi:hypothetical protein